MTLELLLGVSALLIALPVFFLGTVVSCYILMRLWPYMAAYFQKEKVQLYQHPETGVACTFDEAQRAEAEMFSGWVKVPVSRATTRSVN